MMPFTITTKMHTVQKNKLKMCNSYRRNHVKRKEKQRKNQVLGRKSNKNV